MCDRQPGRHYGLHRGLVKLHADKHFGQWR